MPIKSFESVSITLTLFDKNDKEVFECLSKLYGFMKNKDEKTSPEKSDYIVVCKVEILANSFTLRQVMTNTNGLKKEMKCKIVHLDWLIDTLMTGQLKEPTMEQIVDLAPLKKIR